MFLGCRLVVLFGFGESIALSSVRSSLGDWAISSMKRPREDSPVSFSEEEYKPLRRWLGGRTNSFNSVSGVFSPMRYSFLSVRILIRWILSDLW